MAPTQNSEIRILSVVWFTVFPPRFGGQKAVAAFLHHLSHLAPLNCLCADSNVQDKADFQIDNTLPSGKGQVLHPLVWLRILRRVKQKKATHLLLEFPYHGIAALLCKHLHGVKLVVNAHNLEYLRFREQKKWWWPLLYALERTTLRAADAVFFKTEEDRQKATQSFGLNPDRLLVVPYGADERPFRENALARSVIEARHHLERHEKILLFAGTLDYAPNADAVAAIKHKLMPLLNQRLPAYRILVCGRNRKPAFQKLEMMMDDRLLLVGEVADIDNYFLAADVFLNPVLTGGGVQTKTMDALAYHLNVVCFESRRAGIMQAGNKLLAVLDGDWALFADAVVKATEEKAPTPPAFFAAYNWRSIVAQAYQKILSC